MADYEEQLKRADRAVSVADQDLRTALRVVGSGSMPRLAQAGMAALAIGVVGALLMRRGSRRSKLGRAINYSVLLPLAVNVIPRVVAMMQNPRKPYPVTIVPPAPDSRQTQGRRP